jgi:RNA polymerase sigma-70 factor (ECF subfamily)
VTGTTDNAQREQGCAGQDAAVAFEAIFHEHWTRVYAVLFRLVGDRAEAEDLALEVFWRLYRRPPAHEHGSNLSGWLYRVATNLGFNALRAFQRRQRYEEEAGRLVLEAAAPHDPDIAAERAEERQQVRRVLAQMKPRSAQLLILRHSGLSYAELAAALGVSPGSIGTMLARAEREFEAQYRALEGR